LNRFVVDCSVTMAWCFEDEVDAYADSVLTTVVRSAVTVPSIWPFEVISILGIGERRKRLSIADVAEFLAMLNALDIRIDQAAPEHIFGPVRLLARQQSLSAYDAAYLELAVREGLPLATRDGQLKKAARAVGVSLFTA
jgi:predicted nucleic acid-binding protein